MIAINEDRPPISSARDRRHLAAAQRVVGWLLWVDRAGCILDANDAFCIDLGYALSDLLALTYAPFSEAAASDTWSEICSRIDLAGHDSFVTTITANDGSKVMACVTAMWSDESSSDSRCAALHLTRYRQRSYDFIVGCAAVERKREEAEFRRNASLLERAQEIVRLGYWEVDLKTQTVWGSKVAREIYGLFGEHLMIQDVRLAALPEYRNLLDKSLYDLVDHDAPYDVEHQIKRATDGSIVDVRSRAVYHHDEHKVIGVIQDVTSANLGQASIQKLLQAVEQNPASIVITDIEGTIEYVNPKFTEVTGYSREEAIGQNPRILRSEYTEPETYVELWSTLLSGNVWNGTMCNRNKNGELFWESASISPIVDSKGRISHYVAVKEDITHRVTADVELAALSERSSRRLEYLQAAHRIEMAIRQTPALSDLMRTIVTEFLDSLNLNVVALWTRDPVKPRYVIAAEDRRAPLESETNAYEARQRLVDATHDDHRPFYVAGHDCRDLGLSDQVRVYGLVPLSAHGEVLAVLEFKSCAPIPADDEWWNSIETIATVCALALHNARLYDEISSAHTEVVEGYDATLEGWSKALDLRDRETEGHSQRVTHAAVMLARKIGIHEDMVVHVRRGALLHDVGKLGVPDRILLKPGPLTAEEREVMQMHPQYAYEWLSRIPFLKPALDIPHYHHEKWDGTGYPHGLKGYDIPVAARLFTIIDIWDALMSNRPYRAAWPRDKVRSYMLEQSGKFFDPKLLTTFIEMSDSGELCERHP